MNIKNVELEIANLYNCAKTHDIGFCVNQMDEIPKTFITSLYTQFNDCVMGKDKNNMNLKKVSTCAANILKPFIDDSGVIWDLMSKKLKPYQDAFRGIQRVIDFDSDCKTHDGNLVDIKQCVSTISKWDCKKMNTIVHNLKKESSHSRKEFVDIWNKSMDEIKKQNTHFEEAGEMIGRLDGNLKCLVSKYNESIESDDQKLNSFPNGLSKGLRKGKKHKKRANLYGVMVMLVAFVVIIVLMQLSTHTGVNSIVVAGIGCVVILTLLLQK